MIKNRQMSMIMNRMTKKSGIKTAASTKETARPDLNVLLLFLLSALKLIGGSSFKL